jgi:hypothetical protein
MADIKDIQNFEWESDHRNLFIRITCHPYVLITKRAFILKKEWVMIK